MPFFSHTEQLSPKCRFASLLLKEGEETLSNTYSGAEASCQREAKEHEGPTQETNPTSKERVAG